MLYKGNGKKNTNYEFKIAVWNEYRKKFEKYSESLRHDIIF